MLTDEIVVQTLTSHYLLASVLSVSPSTLFPADKSLSA